MIFLFTAITGTPTPNLPLSTGAAVGITLAVSAVVFTILGILIGFLLSYMMTRKRVMDSIAEQQTLAAPAGPPAPKGEIELKSNEAYGPRNTRQY